MKKLKHLFTALLLLCCVGTATAHDFKVGGIYYDITDDTNKTVEVTYGSEYSDEYFNEYTGSVVIPESVTYYGTIYSVTSIGEEAFRDSYGLTSITIPNSVTSIYRYAFRGCTGLTSITIPNSVTSIEWGTFEDCTGLTNVTIPNSVTSIEYYAFKDCSGLTSITIPNSVTSIGIGAFAYCTGLTRISVESGNTIYDSRNNCNAIIETATNKLMAGCQNTIIPNSVTSIYSHAFIGCTGLTSITIPNSVTSIYSYAFYGCTGLTSITIPNSVTSIEWGTFEDCTGLTSITIPNSVTSIVSSAFKGCSGLTSVTIGTGVKNIGSEAFAKCRDLANVYCLATSVPSTDATAFYESYPEYMTLHVPAEAIESYKTAVPWSSFGTIVTLDEDVIETPKCATPTVLYSNGKLHFECETEGAEFVTEITSSDFNKFYNNDINLTATYNISVYATATGYDNSDIVNATLCWIESIENGNDNTTEIIEIPAKAVLITSNNGSINISCQLNGEEVAVYTTAGTLIATTAIGNGAATVSTGLSKGTVAIVKIGNKSIKVIVD